MPENPYKHKILAMNHDCHHCTWQQGHDAAKQEVKELVEACKNFVLWVEDVWGSAALSENTKLDYERAKQALANFTAAEQEKTDANQAH